MTPLPVVRPVLRPGLLAALALTLTAAPAAAQTVSVSSDVLVDTTWGDDETEVVLTRRIFVAGGATLTILPGTLVRGKPRTGPAVSASDDPAALVVTRDGAVDAQGTAAMPVYMTTAAVDNDLDGQADDDDNDGFPDAWMPGDLFLDADPAAGLPPDHAFWLGFYLLGEGPVEQGCTGYEEGIVEELDVPGTPAGYASFGGALPDDASGVVRFVRVRSAEPREVCCDGIQVSEGITLGGVGSKTVFESNDFVSSCWRGFADLHAHPMSHLGFGHREDPGSCTGVEGIFHGSPGDVLDLADRDLGIASDLAPCSPEVHSPCTNLSVEQRITRQTILRVLENRFPNHGPQGAPDFQHWPHAQSRTHQQMHLKWLRQAYEGGMRVMIASVTDSEVLEKWYHYAPAGPDCDVFTPDPTFLYQSALEQIQAIQQLASDNASWLHVADTPEDAFDNAFPLTGPGKLVLILGLELDALSLADTLDLIQNHQVRSVIPIHLVNNSFGGAAVYDDLFNTLNHWQEGDYFHVVNDPKLSFRLGPAQHLNAYQPIPVLGGLCAIEPRLETDVDPGFSYTVTSCAGDDAAGWRNERGISDFEGLFALMQEGILLDLTHMGWASKSDSLSYAEGMEQLSGWGGFPVIDSHTALRDDAVLPAEGEVVSERDLTWTHARRIRKLGGLIGLGTVGDPPREQIVAGPGYYEAERDIGRQLLVRLTGEGREYIAYPAPGDERADTDELQVLKVRLRTGGDNLEGGSTARLLLQAGPTLYEFALKDPGPTWDDYSIHDVLVDQTVGGTPLASLGLRIADLTGVGVRLLGSDDWNIDRLDVLYTGVDSLGGPTGGSLVERFGTPWQRLNGPDESLLTTPVDWRPKRLAFQDYVVEQIHFEWDTEKNGTLDPNLMLVLNLHDDTKREILLQDLSGLSGDPDGGGIASGDWDLVATGGALRYGDIATLVAFATGQSETFGFDVEVRRLRVAFDGCTDATCTTPFSGLVMVDDGEPAATGDEPFWIRHDRTTALLWRGLPAPPPIDRATQLATPLLHLGFELHVGGDGLEFNTPTFVDVELSDGRRFELPVTTTESFGLAAGEQLTFRRDLPATDVRIGDVVSVAFRAPTFLGGVSGDNLDVQRLDVYRLGDPMGKWLGEFKEASWVMAGDPGLPPGTGPYEPGFVALGTDFNGLSPQMGYVDRIDAPDEQTPLELPSPYGGMLARGDTTLSRSFTLDEDGLAHYGMLKDFAEEIQRRDPVAADSLYQSASRALVAWRRATRVAATLQGQSAPPGATTAACGLPACSDGTDNDGDGLIDFPADPGCEDANDVIEVPEPSTWLGLLAGCGLLAALARRRPQRG